MKEFSRLKHLALIVLLSPAFVFAATYAYISKPKVYVKSSANAQGKNIAALRQGTKVAFRKAQGNWYLISYKSSSGQVKSGWVAKGTLSKKPVTAAQPRYNAPVGRSAPASRYTPSPAPRRSSPAPRQKNNYSSRGSEQDSKLLVQAGLGASYYTYDVSSDTRAFSYSFLGPSAQLTIAYNAWQNPNADLHVSVLLDGNFAYYSSKTNLQDNSGAVFSERTQNNMAFHILPGIKVEKDLNPQTSAGLFAGYRYFSFMGKDIIDINSDPLGLYNSYTATGIVVGPTLKYKATEEVTVNLALNAVLMQTYTEDPDGTSGQVGSQSIGYMPNLDIMYNAAFGSLSLRYSFHRIESSFTGDVNRVEQDFTNITAKSDTHFIGVLYNKNF